MGNNLTATVLVEAFENPSLMTDVVMFDAFGSPLPAQVRLNHGGQRVLQLDNVELNADYFIRISSDSVTPATAEGNYRMTVFIGQETFELDNLAVGQLTPSAPVAEHRITFRQSVLLYLAIEGKSEASADELQVTLLRKQNELLQFGGAANDLHSAPSTASRQRVSPCFLRPPPACQAGA